MLQKYQNDIFRVTVYSGLQDCHLYVMKRWILDYITANRYISFLVSSKTPRHKTNSFISGTFQQ